MCCLYTSNVDIPSDIKGIAYYEFDSKVKEREVDIYRELKDAGYKPKL